MGFWKGEIDFKSDLLRLIFFPLVSSEDISHLHASFGIIKKRYRKEACKSIQGPVVSNLHEHVNLFFPHKCFAMLCKIKKGGDALEWKPKSIGISAPPLSHFLISCLGVTKGLLREMAGRGEETKEEKAKILRVRQVERITLSYPQTTERVGICNWLLWDVKSCADFEGPAN